MNFEKLLAENILRYGVKNIDTREFSRLRWICNPASWTLKDSITASLWFLRINTSTQSTTVSVR